MLQNKSTQITNPSESHFLLYTHSNSKEHFHSTLCKLKSNIPSPTHQPPQNSFHSLSSDDTKNSSRTNLTRRQIYSPTHMRVVVASRSKIINSFSLMLRSSASLRSIIAASRLLLGEAQQPPSTHTHYAICDQHSSNGRYATLVTI